MKKKLLLILVLTLALFSCKSLRTNLIKEQKAQEIASKVQGLNFTFEATNVQSMIFRQISLSPDFTLKVSKDTLKAYLTYFGRAYTAPTNSTDGGIQFTSTDFEHQLVPGKKPGQWKFTFKTLDTRNPITMYLEIWDNGSSQLIVNDPDRQTITFDGYVKD
jgi:hypothetical protein